MAQVLSQTLAPVPEQIRAAEQRLTALRVSDGCGGGAWCVMMVGGVVGK